MNVSFLAIDSMNFHPHGGAVSDIIASVHRYLSSFPDHAIQLSFPGAVTTGRDRTLGRRAVLFGEKETLEQFWNLNGETIEQTCVALQPAGLAVRSLERLLDNQPEAVAGYARFSRLRRKSMATLVERRAAHMKSRGFVVDMAEIEEWARNKRDTAPTPVEGILFQSKSTGEAVTLKVCVERVPDAEEMSIDFTHTSSFGLSSLNIVPILRL